MFCSRARTSHVPVSLSPLGSIKLPKNPVDFRFLEPKEKKQGGAFNSLVNLHAGAFVVGRFLARADYWLFRVNVLHFAVTFTSGHYIYGR